MDFEALLDTVGKLSASERKQLLDHLQASQNEPSRETKPWKFNLFPGVFHIDESFDDPLPDEFWLGTDEDTS